MTCSASNQPPSAQLPVAEVWMGSSRGASSALSSAVRAESRVCGVPRVFCCFGGGQVKFRSTAESSGLGLLRDPEREAGERPSAAGQQRRRPSEASEVGQKEPASGSGGRMSEADGLSARPACASWSLSTLPPACEADLASARKLCQWSTPKNFMAHTSENVAHPAGRRPGPYERARCAPSGSVNGRAMEGARRRL